MSSACLLSLSEKPPVPRLSQNYGCRWLINGKSRRGPRLLTSMSVAASGRSLGTRLWGSYNRQLDARPLVTKSFTSFFGFIVGDGVAQIAAGEKYDYWRTARFATYGILVHGPLSHVWYGILDKHVMPRTPKR